MKRSQHNNRTIYAFAIGDTVAAWSIVTHFMEEADFRLHEQIRDLYYKIDPAVGVQYMQFFKNEEGIQISAYMGGPSGGYPIGEAGGPAGIQAEKNLIPLLESLRIMEQEQAAGEPVTKRDSAFAMSPIIDAEEPAPGTPSFAGVDDPAPATTLTVGAEMVVPETTAFIGAEGPTPAGYQGYIADYDPVQGDADEKASHAVAGLVIGIICVILTFFGTAYYTLAFMSVVPIILGWICSISGLTSKRKKTAIFGLILNILAALLFCLICIAFFG